VLGLVAIIISLAALIVSCGSVYLTNLAPAEIELDHLRMPDELSPGGFDPQPTAHDVWLAFFVSNTGARGGLLEHVGISDVSVREGRLWTGVDRVGGPMRQQNPHAPNLGAIALEAGDVETLFLLVQLRQAPLGPEDQAREFRSLESVALTVEWTFRRTRGFPKAWPIVPSRYRHRRERVTRQLVVEVDARPYREAAIARWRSMAPSWTHLAGIAEGRTGPDGLE
jgi:hypothetical protein